MKITCPFCENEIESDYPLEHPKSLDNHLDDCLAHDALIAEETERYWFEGSGPDDEYYDLEQEMQDYPERFYVDEDGNWERF